MPSLNGLAYSLTALSVSGFEEACYLNERVDMSHVIVFLMSHSC